MNKFRYWMMLHQSDVVFFIMGLVTMSLIDNVLHNDLVGVVVNVVALWCVHKLSKFRFY